MGISLCASFNIALLWLRGSVLFEKYGYGPLMKNHLLGLYISLNIPSKYCFIIQATFATTEFSNYNFFRKFWIWITGFEFDKLWEIFEKNANIIKRMLYFLFNFFLIIYYKSTKNTLQNGCFNFLRRWSHHKLKILRMPPFTYFK